VETTVNSRLIPGSKAELIGTNLLAKMLRKS